MTSRRVVLRSWAAAMRRLIRLLLLLIVACAHRVALDNDANAILEVVAQDILVHAKEAPEGDYLLIADKTLDVSPDSQDLENAASSGIPIPLLKDLINRSSEPLGWRSSRTELRSIRQSEIDEIFADGPHWDRFYARYPGSRGFVAFSRPAMNAARTEAVVLVDYNCYGDCGWGGAVHLTRQGDEWVRSHEWLWYVS